MNNKDRKSTMDFDGWPVGYAVRELRENSDGQQTRSDLPTPAIPSRDTTIGEPYGPGFLSQWSRTLPARTFWTPIS
jgi:hypothetical protein